MPKRIQTTTRKEPTKKSKTVATKSKIDSKPNDIFPKPKSAAPKSKAAASKPPQSKIPIPELGDECFGKIFSYLNPNEFCAVKETSRRFASLADIRFQKEFGDKDFVFSPKFDKKLSRTAHVMPPKFWSLFGKFITKLDVHMNNGADAAEHWKGICENCVNLTDLSVLYCDLKLFQPNDFAAQDHQLTALHIACFFSQDEDYSRFIRYFGNMEQLGVQYIHNNSVRCEFLRHNYPRLKEVAFESIEANANFNEFIRLNPQLEKVYAHRCALEYDCLDAIVQHCSNIYSLSIQCDASKGNYAEKIDRLSGLAALKELQFNCSDDSQGSAAAAIKSLARKNSIETLGLTGGRMDVDLCRALCKMKSLKTLILVGFEDVSANSLKKLVCELELAHLHIIWCDDVKYKDLAVAIKNSSTLESLSFDFKGDGVLDSKCFSQLVSARMASRADSPLEFFHFTAPQASHSTVVSVDKQQMQENAECIVLKKHDSFAGYITNPAFD